MSPPKSRPLPVATTDVVPARCWKRHAVAPVSAEIAYTVPALPPLFGATSPPLFEMPYSDVFFRDSATAVIWVQVFCSGTYIMLVSGLYALASQFLPPFGVGQMKCVWPAAVNSESGL